MIKSNDYNKNVKNAFNFLCRPLDLKSYLPIYKSILVKKCESGIELFATDGRRLHKITIDVFIKPGIYEVASKVKNNIIMSLNNNLKYLDIDTVWPTQDCTNSNTCTGFIKTVTWIIRESDKEITINPDYVKALFLDKLEDKINIYYYDKNTPVRFRLAVEKESIMEAIIMPIKM